jgi:UDP-2-acetamido-2,6-beta-L-arabino-hexul-4-ose reductase
MPTLWTHRITNTGTTELTTLFWASELYDAAAPDTYPEAVDV